MSMCIQHCWLYGSIMRGSRNFRQGGGVRKKTLITFFMHQLFYSFKEGYQWFILRKTLFFKAPEGVQHFTGEGVQFFSKGGGGVRTFGYAHAYD